ncbi:MAG TPA: helix-turn-helix domain-containing protein, partial [Vicinamibacterales bacterium]
MFTKNSKSAKRGRPPGRTVEGEATRHRLYETAIRLIGEQGYEATTLRDVAKRAGVSAGLLYRYFPSKRSVVLALYDELSDAFAKEA